LMSGMVFAYAEEVGVRCSLVNNGDDCVVILDDRDLPRFQPALSSWFLQMGFNVKIEAPVREMEQIEFCQAHPVRVKEGWIMMRNLYQSLAKDSVCILPVERKQEYDSWCHSVGTGGLALAGGLPVMQSFYTSLLRPGSKIWKHSSLLDEGLYKLGAGMSRGVQDVLPVTRYSVWLAFGVTPEEQECIEDYYRTHSPIFVKLERAERPSQYGLHFL